jgi:hypothetical protein
LIFNASGHIGPFITLRHRPQNRCGKLATLCIGLIACWLQVDAHGFVIDPPQELPDLCGL